MADITHDLFKVILVLPEFLLYPPTIRNVLDIENIVQNMIFTILYGGYVMISRKACTVLSNVVFLKCVIVGFMALVHRD